MQKLLISSLLIISSLCSSAQHNKYTDSIKMYIDNYILTHDVINGDDKQYFRFFPANHAYRVTATFKKIPNGPWFQMETSGKIKKAFRVYGTAQFSIHDTLLTLNIYQSQSLMQDTKYNDYLFLPFTDLTTGIESYHTGRYIDFTLSDIKNSRLVIDFNKGYNPSCAYITGKYNCPIPPKENNLPVAISAGEMNFAKNE